MFSTPALSLRRAATNISTVSRLQARATAPQWNRVAGKARFLSTPSSPRRAANPQSGKPASDNFSHTVKNVKEEAGKVRSAIESVVAGNPEKSSEKDAATSDTHTGGAAELFSDAKTITGEMTQAMPRPALLWGAAGVIPYVSTAGASIYLSRQAYMVQQGIDSSMDLETATALLLHAQNIQVGYGAVILSFLGGISWGFEFSKYGGQAGNLRYALGVAPLALAWPSLLFTPQIALIGQWAAYVVAWFIDLRSTSAGLAPKWYATYRFWLTLAVGSSIIATLAGTQYYDVDASRSSQRPLAQKLVQARKDEAKAYNTSDDRTSEAGPKKTTKVAGDVDAASASEDEGSYVHISNPKRQEEERKKKEEEKKKKEKEQREKDKEQEAKDKKKSKEEVEEEKEGGDEKEDK